MFPLPNVIALLLAVGSPYVPIIALTAAATSLFCRRALLSAIALALTLIALALQVPWYYFGHPSDVGRYADIRVLSSNLRKGRADPSYFVELARVGADVLTVSELTSQEAQRFSKAGLDEIFPYSMLDPRPGAGGIGLWSRFPLQAVEVHVPYTTIAAARVRVPGVRMTALVASVHLINPVAAESDAFTQWRKGVTGMKKQLKRFADLAGEGAVIVGGDFNSTPDLRQFRDLLTGGYRDAVEQTGAGFAPTFPNSDWLPPLITIDHVITRNAAASSIHTLRIPGSDHRALLAHIEIPLDPPTP